MAAPYLSSVEAAARLGLTDKQVRTRCARGEFASATKTSDGRSAHWRVSAEEVERLAGGNVIDEQRVRAIFREEIEAALGGLRFALVARQAETNESPRLP